MRVFEAYTVAQLEHKAAEIHSRHPYRIAGRPYEVDIDRILSAEGIALLFKYGLLKRHDVAALATVNGKVIIDDERCYDDIRYEKMVRFTLAEEYAHTLLHCGVARKRGVHDKATFKSFMERLPEDEVYEADRNARKLAEAILMPKPDFIQRFRQLRDELNADATDADTTVLTQLTRDFNLNLKPVVFRAANLGLVADSGVILNNA